MTQQTWCYIIYGRDVNCMANKNGIGIALRGRFASILTFFLVLFLLFL